MLKTKLLITSVMATVLTGCCLVDHTKTIEKVAEPMLKELQQFYKEHKRFPTTKERDIMLTRSGCQMRGDVCFFEGEELKIIESAIDFSKNYYFRIGIYEEGKDKILASCGFPIYANGHESSYICSQRPCIQLRQ